MRGGGRLAWRTLPLRVRGRWGAVGCRRPRSRRGCQAAGGPREAGAVEVLPSVERSKATPLPHRCRPPPRPRLQPPSSTSYSRYSQPRPRANQKRKQCSYSRYSQPSPRANLTRKQCRPSRMLQLPRVGQNALRPLASHCQPMHLAVRQYMVLLRRERASARQSPLLQSLPGRILLQPPSMRARRGLQQAVEMRVRWAPRWGRGKGREHPAGGDACSLHRSSCCNI